MSEFRPGLPAQQVDLELRAAVRDYRGSERRVVLWFSDLHRRRLFRKLGFSSIQLYAAGRLGFSEATTAQFLRLCRALEGLPELQRSVACGAVPWTKARAVATVATPETERRWVEKARTVSRRELEREVRETRGRARARRRRNPAQGSLLAAAGGSPRAGGGAGGRTGEAARGAIGNGASGNPAFDSAVSPHETLDVPVSISLRFPPELYARYEALVEKLRKRGRRASREEMIVAALEVLAAEESPRPARASRAEGPKAAAGRPGAGPSAELDAASAAASEGPRGTTGQAAGAGVGPEPDTRGASTAATRYPGSEPGERIPTDRTSGPEPETRVASTAAARDPGSRSAGRHPVYQVVVRQCPECGRGRVVAGREDRPLSPARMEAVLCDARVHRSGQRNRAVIPPALRRRVLGRDGHRCRVPGCGSARFLEVHHLVPRESGGKNVAENLVTLCSGCHATLHEKGTRRTRALLGAPHEPRELTPAS